MSDKRSLLIALIIFLIVVSSLIMLGYSLIDLNWELIQKTAPKDLAFILLVSFLSIGIYTIEIFILLKSRDNNISIWNTYLVLTASMSANYVTPLKVGIPLRVYLYNKIFNLSIGVGSALVTVEALLGLIVPACLSIVGILFIFPDVSLLLPISLLVILIVFISVLSRIERSKLIGILNRFVPKRISIKVEEFIINLRQGLRDVSQTTLVIVVFILILNFIITSIRLFLIISFLGGDASFLGVFFARVISVTAGSVSMIPMGLGVRDASVTFLLTNLGISKEVAFTAALMERIFSPGFPLLLGLVSSNILGISSMKKRMDQRQDKNQTL